MSALVANNFELSIYVLIGIAAFLGVEVLYLTISRRTSYLRRVNARLKLLEGVADQHDVLVQLRRQRSLTSEGGYVLPMIWFNRLVMQSGVGIGIWRLIMLMGGAAVAAFAGMLIYSGNMLHAAAAVPIGGLALPLLVLKFLRGRRRRKFEEQLPDAVDVMVRSLKAGHPLPIAIAMVCREMADPIGSEFGLTADEMTYGLDLETAMGTMSNRVGQDDLALVVVAICIQAKTGGNLSEILGNLSRVVRARFKMRRRIRSLSAEGRFSALLLSILPFAVFGAMQVFAPNFYGKIWDEPITQQVLWFAFGFMMIGNFIMYKMVNFKL